jgi:hypothetical protein
MLHGEGFLDEAFYRDAAGRVDQILAGMELLDPAHVESWPSTDSLPPIIGGEIEENSALVGVKAVMERIGRVFEAPSVALKGSQPVAEFRRRRDRRRTSDQSARSQDVAKTASSGRSR